MALGLPSQGFWAITLREVDVIMRGAVEHELRQKRLADARTYSLAHLISYAVNDPKKMPRFDKVFPDGPAKPQTDEEMLAAMREWVDAAQAAKGVA